MSAPLVSRRALLRLGLASLAGLPGCGTTPEATTGTPLRVDRPGERARFAVIGDYGLDGPEAAAVAELVRGWSPEFIITLGDNNYPHGRASTIDDNVGRYYHDFIHPYPGHHGPGGDINRFFPALGNHDWRSPGARPYLEYFTLPGHERYYELRWGPVHLFAIDSDDKEPDGLTADSPQGQWLKQRLAGSDRPWRVVYMHHPPYSSGNHGSSPVMRWPFAAWGASAVLAGHDHHYERLIVEGVPYFVNGLGGHPRRYELREPLPGSEVRFRDEHGAMRVEASTTTLVLTFVTVTGREIDRHVLHRGEAAAL